MRVRRRNGDENLRSLERTAVEGGSLADWIAFEQAYKRAVGPVPAKAEYAVPLRSAMERRNEFAEDRSLWSSLSWLDSLLERSEHWLLLRDSPIANMIVSAAHEVFELTSRGERDIEEGRELEDGRDLVRASSSRVKVGQFWLPAGLTCGDYIDGNVRTRSNRAVFLDRFGEEPGIFPVTGGYHYRSVAIRLDVTNAEVLEALLEVVAGYSLDEVYEQTLEVDERNDAWARWLGYEFGRELQTHASRLLEKECDFSEVSGERLRGLFARYVREEDWSDAAAGPTCRTEAVVARITRAGLGPLRRFCK